MNDNDNVQRELNRVSVRLYRPTPIKMGGGQRNAMAHDTGS